MSNFGKYGGSYATAQTPLSGGGLTSGERTYLETLARVAEVGHRPVTVTRKQPTGSRLRMEKSTKCGMCSRMIAEGDSYRLRRLPAGSLKACHVSC